MIYEKLISVCRNSAVNKVLARVATLFPFQTSTKWSTKAKYEAWKSGGKTELNAKRNEVHWQLWYCFITNTIQIKTINPISGRVRCICTWNGCGSWACLPPLPFKIWKLLELGIFYIIKTINPIFGRVRSICTLMVVVVVRFVCNIPFSNPEILQLKDSGSPKVSLSD